MLTGSKTPENTVTVLKKDSKSENFEELRYEQYIDKTKSLTGQMYGKM